MIRIAYAIAEPDRMRFRDLMTGLALARRRGGGYSWTLMQDAEDPARFVETWLEVSWIEHLRHHERVSGEDRDIQEQVQALHRGEGAPKAEHFLTPNAEGVSS